MILLKCPKCGYLASVTSGRYNAEIEATISARPLHGKVAIGLENVGASKLVSVTLNTIRCPECGCRSEVGVYEMALRCDQCGKYIYTDGNIDDILAISWCEDGRTIRCFNCWLDNCSRFCEVCSRASGCGMLIHNLAIAKERRTRG